MPRAVWRISVIAPVLILGLCIGLAPSALASQTSSAASDAPLATTAAASSGSGTESIITTLYAYPTLPSWGQVESAAPTVSAAIVDICAPDGSGSGCNGQPADAESSVWVPTIQALQAAGITPLYYIWTGYGTVPLATVESEMLNAFTWYGVSSPMFDGVSTSASEVSYFQALYTFAIANGAKTVMFNPGTVAPQSYMFGPDEILQQFEGSEAQFDAASFPSWMASYPASEFSAVISAGTAAGVGTDVSDAANDGIGNVYVDDEAEPPNYSTLPGFWSAEVQDVANTATRGPQAITFANPGPGTVGQSAALTATGGASGNPVVFTVDASSGAGVCTVSGTNGATVNYLAPGSCVVDANQAAGNGYAAAAQVQQAVTVSPGSQAITFPAPSPGIASESATLTATGGGSGNPVVFTVDASSGAGVCTVSGTNGATVNYLAPGSCVIDANQAAGNGYAAAPQVQQTITVSPGSQAITFSAPGPGIVGQPATLTATGGASGNPVVFTVDASSGAGVCTVSGTNGATVNYLTPGSCVIDANQAAGSGYAAAPQVQQTITVATQGTQAITFANPGPGTVGQSAALTASGGGSGNPVMFTVDASSGAGACTVSGTNGATVNYLAPGSCVVDANQAAGNGYAAAPQVQQAITVSPGSQAITFSAPSSGAAGQSATVTATGGGSGNPVVFTVDASSGAGVCMVSGTHGATVNYLAPGSCVVDANQAAGNGYAAAPQVQQTITVSAGPPAQIAFTTQPSGGANATVWPVQPTVSIEDAYGNVVTTNSSAVTLAIASPAGSGATLSCTKNPVTASAGVAAFAGCKIIGQAGSYTLEATDGTLTSATTSTFSITVGAATKVVFTAQPGGGGSGAAWSTQPKVSVKDSGGNVVTTNSSAVTLAIASQPGSGATLSCAANPVTASAGVAAFAGCKINGEAGSYTLTATDGTLTSATTGTFSITVGAAAKVVFTAQPGGGVNGVVWSAQPKVSVEDSGGNVVTGNASAVTLAIASQPGSGATLSCAANPVTASAGIASFAGCEIIGKAGSYTLKATDGTLTSATTSTFSITVGAAAKVVFTAQPGGGVSGAAWSTQPKVSVEDSGGNVVTGNASAVTLAIASQPGSGATLSCKTNPVTASAGVAAFAGCKITGAAGSYTLKATDGSLTAASSSTFSISA
jgi:trimeric autotransporter adhesin